MSTQWNDMGVEAVCPVCNREHYVLRPWCYAWKGSYTIDNAQKVLYFHSYTCMRTYEEWYEQEKHRRRSVAAKKRHERKKKKSCTKN